MASASTIAVLTRTKNRVPMLERARDSVLGQTHPRERITWAIVNDGGEPGPVDEVAEKARAQGLEVRVTHNPRSVGMARGMTLLLGMAPSDYYGVHDDDDSWEPEFLAKCAAWLDGRPDAGAVCTHVNYITERYRDGVITRLGQATFNDSLIAHQLSEMVRKNTSPPISLCFRRARVAEVGGYTDSLTALEDWDLLLRLLARFDIGVIRERLANYHVRPESTDVNANTILAGWRLHAEWDAVIRNRHLREDLAAGRAGLGHLLALGYLTRGTEELHRFHILHTRLRGKWYYRLFRRIFRGS